MNQEQLDMIVISYLYGSQESLDSYYLEIKETIHKGMWQINVEHSDIENITLPFEYIRDFYTPRELVKVIIELINQIISNSEQWLRDEENYHGDKLAEKGDNDYKSNLEND